jgi:nucleoside-triphosphatase
MPEKTGETKLVALNAEHPGNKPASSNTAPVILLTGRPGIGKTTAIRHVVKTLGNRAGGFYTREVRAAGRRTGFELVACTQLRWATLAGETALLATRGPDVALDRPAPFGRYRVNLDAIDAVGVPALLDALDQGQVVVVDEIGPMEILSPRFRDAILRLLEGDVAVVGTIVLRPQPFADRVKAHPRVTVRHVTRDNRDDLPNRILSELARR